MAEPRTENGRLPCVRYHTAKSSLVGKKVIWRRTVKARLSEVKLTWDKAQHAVQNRAKWKEIIVVSCPTEDEEDY